MPALLLLPRFFFPAFILDIMGLSGQFASILKTSSCESHYLLEVSSPRLGSAGFGTNNNSHLGKEEVFCGPALALEHSGGTGFKWGLAGHHDWD